MTPETKYQKIKRAQSCSDAVVASGYICAGCPLDRLCEVNKKFNAMKRAKKENAPALTFVFIKT